MEIITVENIEIEASKIEVFYEITDGLLQYFDKRQNVFWIEYTENISTIPISIAIVPFVCNVLPIVWLTNSTLILPELDKTFFESIVDFEKGYIEMYPMFDFKGKLEINKIVDNSYPCDGGNAAFFSGGVDAFTTLICHRKEAPTLVTLRGSDVKLDDIEGWSNVYEHLLATVSKFQLPKPICITSNFRTFIDEIALNKLVANSKDGWWHGFQCGIGLIAQIAPVAYLKHFDVIYIASSYTLDDKIPSASYPTIDNYIRFGNSRVVHDQYEHHRQEKIQILTNYCREKKDMLNLRVCWISTGGKNCCHCEKCIRTIFALMVEGESPQNYGFDKTEIDLEHSKEIVVNALYTANDGVRSDWMHIKDRFIEKQLFKEDKNINWIYKLDPYASKPKPSVILRFKIKIAKVISLFGIKV